MGKRKLKDFLIESRDKGTDGLKAKKLTVKLWGKGVVKKESVYLGSSATKYFTRHAGQLMYGKLDFLHGAFGIVPQELEGYESTLDSPAFNVLEINQYFLLQKLLQKNFYLYEGLIANGSRKAKRIHVDTFLDMSVKLPKREEQDKVACIFQNLDQLITVNQRKVDLLKKKKAGYLQKLFPRNGQNKPELRFKGYTYAWEKRKLESIFKERTERSSEGTMLSVTINDGVVLANSLSRKNVSSSDKSNYKLVRKDDIAYNSMRMWQSASGVSNYEGIVSPAYTVLIPEHDVNSSFFGYYFKRTVMKQVFQKNSQGLTSDTWNLKYPLLKNIVVQIPSIEEQIKISEFLKQVDKLIAVNQRKVDLLKKEKKSLLQKMFV